MKTWRLRFLYFLVLNVAAVPSVTSLEEELTDSIFGESPVQTTHVCAKLRDYFKCLMCAHSFCVSVCVCVCVCSLDSENKMHCLLATVRNVSMGCLCAFYGEHPTLPHVVFERQVVFSSFRGEHKTCSLLNGHHFSYLSAVCITFYSQYGP